MAPAEPACLVRALVELDQLDAPLLAWLDLVGESEHVVRVLLPAVQVEQVMGAEPVLAASRQVPQQVPLQVEPDFRIALLALVVVPAPQRQQPRAPALQVQVDPRPMQGVVSRFVPEQHR